MPCSKRSPGVVNGGDGDGVRVKLFEIFELVVFEITSTAVQTEKQLMVLVKRFGIFKYPNEECRRKAFYIFMTSEFQMT